MGLLVVGGAVVAAIIFGVVWGARERRPSKGSQPSSGLDDLGTFIIVDSIADSISDFLDD